MFYMLGRGLSVNSSLSIWGLISWNLQWDGPYAGLPSGPEPGVRTPVLRTGVARPVCEMGLRPATNQSWYREGLRPQHVTSQAGGEGRAPRHGVGQRRPYPVTVGRPPSVSFFNFILIFDPPARGS